MVLISGIDSYEKYHNFLFDQIEEGSTISFQGQDFGSFGRGVCAPVQALV
ncbi:MAG: hypothetical protein OXT67_10285 [Zetaproteobacteria bacterium]|nr:hypothetical protein [Zetaproteobacteria bacterium]